VNKTDLIEHIAKQADISKAAAGRALEALIGGVRTTLKKNGSVTITGFGTFAVTKRAARTGRNPRTGVQARQGNARASQCAGSSDRLTRGVASCSAYGSVRESTVICDDSCRYAARSCTFVAD